MKKFGRNVVMMTFGALAVVSLTALGAAVGGQIAEINAKAAYFETITATGLVKINIPGSYADNTAACAAGLVAGNMYYTSGTPNVLKVVTACS